MSRRVYPPLDVSLFPLRHVEEGLPPSMCRYSFRHVEEGLPPRRVLFLFRPGEDYHYFRLDAERVSTPHHVVISLTERAQKVHRSLFLFIQILTTLWQDFNPTKRCTPPCWVIYTTVLHLTPPPHPSLTFLATPSLARLRDISPLANLWCRLSNPPR